jgi:hypothetical protein
LIFGSVTEDYYSVMDEQGTPPKRKPTPVSTEGLRSSARKATLADGFKSASPALTRSKAKKKKEPNKVLGNGKNNQPPFSLDFPDLVAIHNVMASGALYPEIPIEQHQKVAMETCGMLPKEVTTELLLATEEEVHESRDEGALQMTSS